MSSYANSAVMEFVIRFKADDQGITRINKVNGQKGERKKSGLKSKKKCHKKL